jgi:hypothetical protein
MPHDQRRDQQHEDRPDQGTEHAAPVEDVGVADAEADGEDEVADKGSDQPEHERGEPGQRPAHLPEGVARNEHPGHDPAEQAEKQRSDHVIKHTRGPWHPFEEGVETAWRQGHAARRRQPGMAAVILASW